jgi:multiple sugar transport system permease protein
MDMTRLRDLLPTLAAALASAVTLVPLAWMISVSLMASGEASRSPAPFLPAHATLAQYRALFSDYAIGRPLLNSALVSAVATVLGLCLMVPAGYAFARLRFRGREALVRGLVALLVVPGQVAMLPLFLLLRQAGLVNSYAGAIAPWLAGVFGVLYVRQAALSLPDEMLDAARIDGATEWQVFTRVVEPVLRPVTVTLALFTFLGVWNDFLWPLIVLSDDRLYTLPVALATLSREHAQDAELMMAGSVVTTLPVLAIFLAVQRQYIAGVLGGSIKGYASGDRVRQGAPVRVEQLRVSGRDREAQPLAQRHARFARQLRDKRVRRATCAQMRERQGTQPLEQLHRAAERPVFG